MTNEQEDTSTNQTLSDSETANSVIITQEIVEETPQENHEHEIPEDYSHYGKEDFLTLLKKHLHEKDFRKTQVVLKEIRHLFDELLAGEKLHALEKFIEEGGNKKDFDFKEDEATKKFYQLYQQIQSEKAKQFAEIEQNRETNLVKKNALLEKLRTLTDAEESQVSINELKKIQDEWKSIGQVPNQYNKSLWASYNALIELFYSQRSIYFELKELDKRKNLAQKLVICEKAEKLADMQSIQQAIKELNELHEEFKHIGPVPKDEQEIIWQRFKMASDKVYDKKRDYIKQQEVKKKENLVAKMELCKQLEEYAAFQSDNIVVWNQKTKEILEIQKTWEAIRFIPQEGIKEAGKHFWIPFKTFFNNKNAFIRTLDEAREENFKLKVSLCEEAEAFIQNNQDGRKIADKLKQLQIKWREIGPVPAKHKKSIFDRFKNTCDGFFKERREKIASVEQQYEDNLKKKEELCAKIAQTIPEKDTSIVEAFLQEWQEIGYVPKNDKNAIQEHFAEAITAFVKRFNTISENEKDKLILQVEVSLFKDNPNAFKHIQQKEANLRKQIQKLEGDIDTLKNNMGFFAKSNKANTLKESIEKEINESTEKLKSLKRQLKIFQSI